VLRGLAKSVKEFEGVTVEAMALLGMPMPVSSGV
jgi:hypothetical protein